MFSNHQPSLLFILLLGFAGCSDNGVAPTAPDRVEFSKVPIRDRDPVGERIRVWRDLDAFEQAAGPIAVATFDALPEFGSSCRTVPPFQPIPNPLDDNGVMVYDPVCLESFTCPAPICEEDNVVLHVGRRGRIEVPPGSGGMMLVVEGMGNARFALVVMDWDGNRSCVVGRASSDGPAYYGFTSSSGIASIQVVHVQGSGHLVLNRVLYQGAGEWPRLL